MSQREELDLTDDEKVAIANFLFGEGEPFEDLTPAERKRLLDDFDSDWGEGVERRLNDPVSEEGAAGPRITDFHEYETTLSSSDNAAYSKTYLFVVNDKLVSVDVHYPEYCDDENDGAMGGYEVRPASELEDEIRRIKKGIADSAIGAALSSIGEDGFDLLMEVMLERRARVLSPRV